MSARGRSLLLLALAAAGLLAAMAAVGPPRSLDRLLWYTPDEALALLSALGPEGQARYLRNELIDLAFLCVYSAFAFIAAAPLWERALRPGGLRLARGLCLLPGALDLAETSLVISALTGDPAALPAKLRWLCVATPAKWAAAAALAVFAAAGAVNMVISRGATREAS